MEDFKTDNIQFKEVQQFRQGWLWTLLVFGSLVSILLPLVLALQETKNRKEALWTVAGVFGLQLINLSLFYITKLETVISNKGVYYRWRPFFKRFTFLDAKEIATVESIPWTNTNWGFSKTKKFGRAHTVSGNRGVLIQMKDGRKYYIGSQQALSMQMNCEKIMTDPLKYA